MARDIERGYLLVRDISFLALFSATAACGVVVGLGAMGAGMIAQRLQLGLIDG